MILEKGECVLTGTITKTNHIAYLLNENGYKFHHGVPIDETCDWDSRYGFRFWTGGEYPNCIASLDEEMVEELSISKHVYDPSDEEGEYCVLSYEEFITRVDRTFSKIEVEDLL